MILHEIHAKNMVRNESFQVAAVTKKLPLSWKDFESHLKHKRKEMELKDLIMRLRIEEDKRNFEKKFGGCLTEAKANIVETRVKKDKKRKHSPKYSKNNKKSKFNGKCFYNKKLGHKAQEYSNNKGQENPKKNPKTKVNMIKQDKLSTNI